MNRPTLVAGIVLALLTPTVAACGPKKAPDVAVAPTPPPDPNAWRATRPPPGAEKAWTAPTAQNFQLSNGIPVYLVKQGELPLASVRVLLKAGREANPKGKAGLQSLTANLLDEGTKTRDSAGIAAEAARLGAELSVSPGDEGTVVALDSLTGSTLGPSLDLLADVVLRPKFDKAAFARVQSEVLTGIQSAKSEPRDVAMRVFLEQMWGDAHPYGSPSVGSEGSVKALKLADVTKAYAEQWHAGNAAIVVSGNIDEVTLKPLLEARFGSWKKGKGARASVSAPSVPLKTRLVFVEQPGAVQSVLRIGTFSPSRTSAEYWPTQVAATLFGGMFSSRLNMNLREEHGWSYGAYGAMTDSRDFGLFAARSSVQADKTAPAVMEVVKEMAAQAGRSPSPEEMKLTVDNLVKSLPGNFATNAFTAGAFLQAPSFGLGADAWANYGGNVSGVTPEAAGAAGKTLLDVNRSVIVVVGPRTIEVDDGKGGKIKVDVVGELKGLGYEYVEVTR